MFYPPRSLSVCLSLLVASATASSQVARVAETVQDSERVSLHGNVHPLIASATASTPVEPSMPMEQLVLHLRGSAAQEAELEELIAQQSDPHSPNYHKFLTPQEFGARFGVASADIAKIVAWLKHYGLTVEHVTAANRSIVFSGTADQVANAFNTEIRQYTVGGVRHIANASDPQVPKAFAGVVAGVLKLHDFQHEARPIQSAQKLAAQSGLPAFAPEGLRWLTPGDYGVIYDINPLLSSGIDGTGQSIAVLARSNIYLSDVESFRSMFGLKSNAPTIVITNSDPGQVNGDNTETTLDTEWAGAIAPGATIKVIVSSSSSSRDGIDLSALYAVNNNVAPIITLSYGSCEAAMGATELAFYNSLWQQAAAQGQTVLVAAGDSGAAGCDHGTKTATQGKGVNGLCSSPYATCVGGTEFVEGTNPGQYWLPSGPGATAASALSYIPEAVWNESGSVTGGAGIWAGGGGASKIYTKPTWQTGKGVPADGWRDVPDVSLTAASHDGYTVVQGGMLGFIFGISGTSASTPSFAGIMALVNQKTNSSQGNINPMLYQLAAKQAAGGSTVFHDTASGTNSVPGVTGYAATVGYDLASGLGSVDANLLATLWNSATSKPATLTVAGSGLVVNVGQTGSTNIATVASGLNAAVTVSVSGVPTGVTATLASTSIASPGSGSLALKLAVASTAAPGTYTLTVKAAGGTQTATSTLSLTIVQPTFTLSYNGGLYPMLIFGPNPPYTPQTVPLKTLPGSGFNSTITFSATGMPSGMTVTFAPTTVPGSSVGNTVATVTAASTLKGGSYNVTISASGGGVTQSVTYLVQVFVQPTCSLTPTQYSTSFKAGAGTTFSLTCNASNASKNPVTLSVTGLPGGVTGKFSAATITTGGSVSLVLTSTSGVNPGTYPITVTGSEPSGATQNLCLFVAISTPVFTLSLNPTTVTAVVGTSQQFTAVVTPQPGFNSPVTVWIGGRPNGVAVSFGSNSVSNPSTVLTLTVDSSAVPGTYPLTLGAIANTGYSQTIVSTLTIAPPPVCTLATGALGFSLVPGQSASSSVTCAVTKGSFPAPLSLSVSGLPQGVSSQFAPATLTPGSPTVLTLNSTAAAATGSSSVSITATGSGFTKTISVPLTVVAPSFAISTGSAALTLKAGSTTTMTVNTAAIGLFNSPISLSALNLPPGVTATFSTPSISVPGSGTATMTLTASSAVRAGSYTINPTGTGGGLTAAAKVTLTVSH